MELAKAQAEQFRAEGFLIVEDFYSEREILAMRAEIDRFKNVGLLRNVHTEGDGATHSQTHQNLQLCPMQPHSPLFRALPFDPKVVQAIESLIGSPMLQHLDQVFLKPARTGRGTGWHQDNAYFKIDQPLMGTAMWIAVHDATVENGTMQLIPRMVDMPLPHDRDPNSDHHIGCEVDESQAVPCVLKAGGVAFFAYGTPHCTKDNTSDGERAGVAYHFLRADHAHPELIQDDRDCRPYLTGSNASQGLTEYGVSQTDAWEREIEKTLRAAVV
jgi:ectoine hydroxylase-related dioxygenase (phytanoyl-CoA dioxygenase family)